jgi:hypothetical protein
MWRIKVPGFMKGSKAVLIYGVAAFAVPLQHNQLTIRTASQHESAYVLKRKNMPIEAQHVEGNYSQNSLFEGTHHAQRARLMLVRSERGV